MELSQRAYAKHRGISEAAVRRAIKNGRIVRNKNGRLDPQKADKEWQKNTDPAQIKITNKVADVQEGQSHNSQSSSSVSLAGPSYQQSRAFKRSL